MGNEFSKCIDNGNKLYDQERYSEAIEFYDMSIQINPNNSKAYVNKAYALENLQMYSDAIKCYDKAIEISPKYSDAINNKGILLRILGKYFEALDCHENAIKINSNDTIAYNSRGCIFEKLEKFSESLECYDKVIKITPNNSEAYLNKGNILIKLGNFSEALDCNNKAIQIDPNNATAYNNKGIILRKLGRYLEAVDCFNKAIQYNPNSYTAYYNKGNTLSDLEKYSESIECYDLAIKINSNYSSAYNNKGISLKNINKHLESIECFDMAIKINSSDYIALYNKGNALKNLNKFLEAIKCYDQAIEIDQTFSSIFISKGEIFEYLENYPEAIECYDKAIQINPECSNSKIYNKKGNILKIQKMYFEAIECYDKAIEIDPKDEIAQNEKRFVLEKLEEQKLLKTNNGINQSLEELNAKITAENVNIVKRIGGGEYGSVYYCKINLIDVAVKIIQIHEEEKHELIKSTKNELCRLLTVTHPNLISYLGSFENEENNYAIVTEFCKGGDLLKLIRNQILTLNQKIFILMDVVEGMLYLHSLNPPIIHKDLKSSNILLTNEFKDITSSLYAKVGDFGTANIMQNSKLLKTITGSLGSIYWTAPEILKGQTYSLKSDIYSFGIVMWELFSGKFPYQELNLFPFQIIMQICSINLRPNIELLDKETPQEIISLINQCFEENPNERPSFDYIHIKLKNLNIGNRLN